jgi:hypothetical protein
VSSAAHRCQADRSARLLLLRQSGNNTVQTLICLSRLIPFLRERTDPKSLNCFAQPPSPAIYSSHATGRLPHRHLLSSFFSRKSESRRQLRPRPRPSPSFSPSLGLRLLHWCIVLPPRNRTCYACCLRTTSLIICSASLRRKQQYRSSQLLTGATNI